MTDAWGALQQREHNLRSFRHTSSDEFRMFLARVDPVAVEVERPKRRGRPRLPRVLRPVVPLAVSPDRQFEIAIAALEKQEALKGQEAGSK